MAVITATVTLVGVAAGVAGVVAVWHPPTARHPTPSKITIILCMLRNYQNGQLTGNPHSIRKTDEAEEL